MTIHTAARPGRVERKKEETKKKIVAAAWDLFTAHGVDVTTMEQIAEAADIAKGTLYNYFPEKEAIISAYIQQSFQGKYADRVQDLENLPDTRRRMRTIFSQLVEGIQSQKEIFEKYSVYQIRNLASFRKEERAAQQSGFSLLVGAIIALGQKSGELRDDLPQFILEDLFEFAFMEAVKQFYMHPESYNGPQAIDASIDLFLNGARRQNHLEEVGQ